MKPRCRTICVVVAVFWAALTGAFAVPAGAKDEAVPAVNYVSADAVYLNVGKYAGLQIGARVEVLRGGRVIAVLEVEHISSHSASCRVVEQTEAPRAGDRVAFEPARETSQPLVAPPSPAPIGPPATRAEPVTNVVRGTVALETVWQGDLTGSGISSFQPAIAARVVVDNVAGTGLVLRFRDRLRYYHRSHPPGALIKKDEWTHRLTELALTTDRSEDTFSWGVGRLIAPHMVGVGQIDGGYAALRINRYFQAGLAGGLEPDPADLSIDAHRQLAGLFVAFEYASQERWRFSSSAALAGSYVSGNTNRDFVYWQNAFSLTRGLSLFQSAELDLNRGWRRDAVGEAVTLSNFYFVANAEPSQYVLIDFAYDSRKNVRYYDTIATPDSLFDDALYDGFGGGVTFRLPRGVTAGGRAGIRYREDERTNRYYSLYARATRLPWRGHSLMVRYASAETRLATGYRPTASYRFPAGRKLRMTVNAGGYIYSLGTRRTSSMYAEAGAYYPFGRYFASGSYRQYFGGNLESILMFAEVGLHL